MARDQQWITNFLLADPVSNYILVAYGRVYDVSTYLNTVQVPTFLGSNIKQIIAAVGQTGQDATSFMNQVKNKEGAAKWKRYISCMDEMFFVGVVDQRSSVGCQAASYIVLSTSIFIVVILAFKFLAALHFSSAGTPQLPERFVICSVPCYNESLESLRLTFISIAATSYAENRKLLFVVVDGVVRGQVGRHRY